MMALLVALFGGWLVFRGQKDAQNRLKQPVQLIEKPQEVQASDAMDTSNWKTYRNEEYGFEIKYPREWVVSQEAKITFFISNESEKVVPLLELKVERNGTVEEWVRNFDSNRSSVYTQIISQEEYHVGRNTGTKIIHSTDIGLNKEVILIQNGEKTLIVFSFSDVKSVSPYYEKILQTLRLNL
ncbi:MAG: hypothetical protein WAU31_01530 [Candidatus Moraniibacteriota bacterium]